MGVLIDLFRDLLDNEEDQFATLLNIPYTIYILVDGEDSRIWVASKDRSFSVSYFLFHLFQGACCQEIYWPLCGRQRPHLEWLHSSG